jgi:hypothetical protein
VIVLALFALIGVSMLGWYLVQKRRVRERSTSVTEQSVTEHWLTGYNYPKDGDSL